MADTNFSVDRAQIRKEHFGEGEPTSENLQGFSLVASCHEADDCDPSPDPKVTESDESIAGTVAALCADFDERCWKGRPKPHE